MATAALSGLPCWKSFANHFLLAVFPRKCLSDRLRKLARCDLACMVFLTGEKAFLQS